MDQATFFLTLLKIASIVLTLMSGIIAGLWAYLVFIVGRGLLPAIQFDINVNQIGTKGKYTLLDVSFLIENKGQYPLVVEYVKTKIRYIEDDDLHFESGEGKPNYCRLIFPRSLGLLIKTGNPISESEIDTSLPLVTYKTFVQPGIVQQYNFLTALPIKAEYLLVKGMFKYAVKPLNGLPGKLIDLGCRLRVIPFKFVRIEKPHSVEKVVKILAEESKCSTRLVNDSGPLTAGDAS